MKQGPASQAAPQQPVIADKQAGHEPASPRSLQRSRYIDMLLSSVISFYLHSVGVVYVAVSGLNKVYGIVLKKQAKTQNPVLLHCQHT